MADDDGWYFGGRRALVTGGASGIGRAVVTQLLRRGATVVSFDVQDQDDGPTPQFTPVRVDLADAGVVDAALAEHGEGVDLLCNAAGVSPLGQDVATVVAVDFLAARRILEWTVPRMRPGGSAVSVASVAALHDLLPGAEEGLLAADDAGALAHAEAAIGHPGLAYVVAKRAVLRLSRRLAAEHAGRWVRVNCTSPHFAATPMHQAIKREDPGMYRDMPAPMGRWSSPDEQADAVLFLLSPRASYITGQNLVVDGGWEAVTAEAASGPAGG